MKRPPDTLRIETNAGGANLLQDVQLTNDFAEPASMEIAIGDDRAWETLNRIVYPGEKVQLYLGGQLQFTGRWEENGVHNDPHGGGLARVTARTKLADVHYTTAPGGIAYSDVSLKAFLLALVAPIGLTIADFNLDATTDRQLLTGQKQGAPALVDLEPLLGSKAKPQLGELMGDVLTRHLKRFHLTWWDGADGRIVIGKPDDTQLPAYKFISKKGPAGTFNNCNAERIRDWSEVPASVRMFANTVDADDDPITVSGTSVNRDVFLQARRTGHFNRFLQLPIEGLKTTAKAGAQANRERANRSKKLDAWEVDYDGWAFWNGQRLVPLAINTVVDTDFQSIGSEAGAKGSGRYIIHRLVRKASTRGGFSASVHVLAPGILVF